MKEFKNIENMRVFSTDFYLLKKDEKFKYKNKIYIKLNDDKARQISNNKIIFLWPFTTVYFLEPVQRCDFQEKYLNGQTFDYY